MTNPGTFRVADEDGRGGAWIAGTITNRPDPRYGAFGDEAYVAHVGDPRSRTIILIRGGCR